MVSPGSKPDGVTSRETTCGTSSAELGEDCVAGLDCKLAEFSRDEDQMFSARLINGMLTAAAAVNKNASGSSFLFDMSTELKFELRIDARIRN